MAEPPVVAPLPEQMGFMTQPGCEVTLFKIVPCCQPAAYKLLAGCVHEHVRVRYICEFCFSNWDRISCLECDPDHTRCKLVIITSESLVNGISAASRADDAPVIPEPLAGLTPPAAFRPEREPFPE